MKIKALFIYIICIFCFLLVSCEKSQTETPETTETITSSENTNPDETKIEETEDIEDILPDDIVFETGTEIRYYPKDVDDISFQRHTPYPVIAEVCKVEKNIYKLRIVCAMLSNSTADGTYSADFCYYLKKGDVIEFKKPSLYLDEFKKLKVKSLTWNKVVFEELKDENPDIIPTEDSL